MKKFLLSIIALATTATAMAGDWTKVTDTATLLQGGTFIIGYDKDDNLDGIIVPMQNVCSTSSTKYMFSGAVSGKSGNTTIDISSVTATAMFEVTIEASKIVTGAVNIIAGGKYLSNANAKNSCTLVDDESATTAFTPTVADGVFTLTIAANADYKVLQYNASSPRFAVYKSGQQDVVIYKKTGTSQSKQPSGLGFTKPTFTVTLGETATLPTLNNPNGLAVTYSSTDTSVATVNAATGEVTIVAAGETNIQAQSAETATFEAGLAQYTLTVKEPAAVVTEATIPYNEAFSDGIGSFTLNDVTLGEGLSYVWKHDASNKYMKASAFVSGQNIASESWLVSPTINLTDALSATLAFSQCTGFVSEQTDALSAWIKQEGGEWQNLNIVLPLKKATGNWSEWKNESIDLAAYLGKKVQVAFKYVSTNTAAPTWEIKKFSVTGTTTAITAPSASQLQPTATYNISGQRVNASTKGIVISGGRKHVNK